MKTTVKLGAFLKVTVEPTRGGEVRIGLHTDCQTKAVFELDENQAGAFIFGIEQAFEAADRNHRKELENIRTQGYADKYSAKDIGTRCHGDACAAGQLPCPTRAACGVAA
jgi:hypothetical protein